MAAPQSTIEIREKIITLAESQLGVSESPAYSNNTPYTRWYGLVGPWCAMFVSWVFFHAGLPLPITTSKGFAYCPYGVNWFKNRDAWASKTTKPKRGWIVFFDFIGRPSHVGIVAGVAKDGRIITLEGNTNAAGSRTGGNVMRHYRSTSGGIIGYGIVDYVASEKEQEMLDKDDKEWLRNLATEIAGNRSEVEMFGQKGVRRDSWRWTGEAVTILRQVAVDKIVAGVIAGINSGDVDEATLTAAVEKGVKKVLLEGVNDD